MSPAELHAVERHAEIGGTVARHHALRLVSEVRRLRELHAQVSAQLQAVLDNLTGRDHEAVGQAVRPDRDPVARRRSLSAILREARSWGNDAADAKFAADAGDRASQAPDQDPASIRLSRDGVAALGGLDAIRNALAGDHVSQALNQLRRMARRLPDATVDDASWDKAFGPQGGEGNR